ncbi:carbohydrate ABC transporter permease [Paenibacillus sp. OAS669]|uniref:carbohydrate ABC transporter permease n=1 Tax=Paenibacillus sp. OAS669 TaxID=2663821 RepID=UPI00178A36F5|nr:carbohydrate ABC transporter permease [Paenibacillus sp. OAS669]MBE1445516.1 N-acetylglucosamine transport system permease protein [Paenibacillus sp. OAS669]
MRTEIRSPLLGFCMKLILAIWTVCVLYPLVWTVLGALKDNAQFMQGKPWDLPKLPLVWSNYSYVWEKYHIGGYFLNSLLVTVLSTILAALLAATTAYVLARYTFRGSGLLYTAYMASMMIPMILGLIPLFFLLNDLHLINSLFGLSLVYGMGALPFGVFVLVGFFKSLPREMEEAAFIDGASHYRTFFQIMLPLARPGIISVSIMNVLNIWNEYIMGTVFINDPAKYTLPVGIAIMQGEMQYRTEWGPLFAALLISMLPVLVFYVLFQRQIAGGITAGAIK